jgi:eukaryotic-like serine/threonine-protein kinase
LSRSHATDDVAAATELADWPALPGYELLSEIGRGGMGVVFRARQSSSQRMVALKLIRDGALATAQDRARLWIEAEAVARVVHPSVVEVYDAGEHDGRPYFAMEFVAGGTLAERIAGQPQSASFAARIASALARAVACAHEHNVIHRDLKPANILLQPKAAVHHNSTITNPADAVAADPGGDVIPKIADFGLAKRLDSQSTAWTQAGAVLGTASYMAPEQAAGRISEIGPAVDIYALGAILYELLTGRPPFQSDSWQQTIHQVMHDEPLPPTQHVAAVPRDLETICLKCLEKNAAQRYATAGALADDLDRFLSGAPVAAVPLDQHERLVRLAARDGYQIVSEVGRGPRSTVYHALFGPLRQHVAVKVFDPGICTRDEWEARVEQSAVAWSAVTHPHVIPVVKSGWWDGSPYLVHEYVPGGNLATLLAGKPYPIPRALRLAELLGETIAYIHRQGVVHGNLKPTNILVAADGIPRINDFHSSGGWFLAPLEDGAERPPSVNYLAPELAAKQNAEPRPYSDVYGLGLILYELLTGRPAMDDEQGEPLPLSRFNRSVTPELEAFCLRSLRNNPWTRYPRVYDWLSHLRYIKNQLEQ